MNLCAERHPTHAAMPCVKGRGHPGPHESMTGVQWAGKPGVVTVSPAVSRSPDPKPCGKPHPREALICINPDGHAGPHVAFLGSAAIAWDDPVRQADPRRDLFAAAALTGIMAGVEGDGGPFTERDYARRAWEFADAMLVTEPKS